MIEHGKNQNVVAATLQQNQYGLLEASFVCEGMPEYPTALRSGNSPKGEAWTIYDDPLFAFRNGAPAPKYPPQYSYHRANRQIPSWTCKSVLFGDGSAYVANEPAREIADEDKRRVFAAELSDWNYGLKVVRFDGVGLIGGKPIYPTALKSGKSLYELASDAFWGGEATANIPFEARNADDVLGAVWSAKSIVFRDGSAYAKEESARALADTDKMRIFAAELADWNYGLKVVRFDGVGLIGGKPIFPTALKTGKALSDKPLDAFWGGSATVNMPYETVLKDDNAGAVWSAKSIVFADGSAYAKEESARELTEKDKMRIFSARLADWNYGLKVVQFDGVGLIGGKPIFPTALKSGKTLTDKPLDAFWGGSATVNMPYETVLKDDNAGAVWSAKSIVFADGSAYAKSVPSESVSYTKMRIFSARVFDAELGLKCVEFRGVGLVGGKPAYPTALAGGMMLSENPRDAFFSGTATVRLPWSADYTDNDAGVVWTARSYVKADGSAVSASEANVLREYFDIITFNFPSIIDLNVNGVDGVCEIAGAARKYKAKITEKLVSASALNSALVVPYHIARWAFYSVGGYNKKTGTAFVDSKSIHGALGGVANALSGTYKGMEVSNTVSYISSEPLYSGFIAAMKAGQEIECGVKRAFTDAGGLDWFVVRTVFLKLSADGLSSGDYGE